ncbi:(deoxy)nucleoside triphosphate pyrophosphohydrolase [Fundicoccus ignavus]|uniref:8-oxo-dGTP diphosphatase n=1 Tax=Fundicoccus ignavus TaxID=2664442 RepID=A0A844C9T5_9LACT|nr:(deoxy)nucleoside triphosphate pyrophosphohydrolase [Fundicoccus ignavus]MRJ47207.1 NUDIX domain-containing protein [Fundicoccus ignavus]
MKKIIKVVGAILIKEGRILCAQRGGEKSLPFLWEFPGGKIEQGESPHQALIRELSEELLIEVELEATIFDAVSYEYDFGVVNLTTIIGKLKSGEPVLTEHQEIRWLSPEELFEVEWAPADIPIVKQLSKMHFNQ